jgi:hypothetical protein
MWKKMTACHTIKQLLSAGELTNNETNLFRREMAGAIGQRGKNNRKIFILRRKRFRIVIFAFSKQYHPFRTR